MFWMFKIYALYIYQWLYQGRSQHFEKGGASLFKQAELANPVRGRGGGPLRGAVSPSKAIAFLALCETI